MATRLLAVGLLLSAVVHATWNSTCPSPSGPLARNQYSNRICRTHEADASVGWKQIATDVTINATHIDASVLIYPDWAVEPGCGYNCGPDYAKNGPFRHRTVHMALSALCASPDNHTICDGLSYQSYGWLAPNASTTDGCVRGPPEPYPLLCPVNRSLDLRFCLNARRSHNVLLADTWVVISRTQNPFITSTPLHDSFFCSSYSLTEPSLLDSPRNLASMPSLPDTTQYTAPHAIIVTLLLVYWFYKYGKTLYSLRKPFNMFVSVDTSPWFAAVGFILLNWVFAFL
jgi:hypothetical protein